MINIRCIAVLITALVILVGCDEKKSPPQTGQTDRTGRTIKIGIIYPQSGPNAATGDDLKAGFELAADIVNTQADLSLPLAKTEGLPGHSHALLQLIYRDSKNDPAQASKAVTELLAEGAVAVIGCYSSTVTAAASERAEMLKIPFLNPVSTSPILIRRGFKWFFRTTPDDDMFAKNFFTFLDELKKQEYLTIPDRISLVYENRLYGTSVSQAERKQACKHGFAITGDIPYDADAEQFDAELEQVRSSMPAIILQTSYSRDAVMLMKGYKKADINPVAILGMNAGFISPEFIEKLGKDAEHVFSREVWSPDLGEKKPLIAMINKQFRTRFTKNMTGNSARAFTGLLVMAEAVNRAESLSPESIRSALLNTRLPENECIMPWDGIKFDPATGQNTLGKGIIVQIQNGVYRTVWPRAFSSSPLIWPVPSWSERKKNE